MNTRALECNFTNDIMGWQTNRCPDTANGNALVLSNPEDAVKNTWYDVEPSDCYTLEARVKITRFGRENGMKLERGHMRLMVYFRPGAINCVGADGNYSIPVEHMEEYNTYKFVVVKRIAFVYINGVFKQYYHLGPWRCDSTQLTFFLRGFGERGDTEMIVDYVRYTPDEEKIVITSPIEGETAHSGGEFTLKAQINDPSIPYVDFYSNDTLIGRAPSDAPELKWSELRAGNYFISAKYGEYESCGEWLTVTSGVSGERPHVAVNGFNGKVGDFIELCAGTEDADIKNVVYYLNGRPVDARCRLDIAGKSVVSAKIEYNDGSHTTSGETPITAVAHGTDGITLTSNYVLTYIASENAHICASDGVYALVLDHKDGSVIYETADGCKEYSLGFGSYRLHIDSGVCDVYFEEQFAFSFRMPITDKENGITAVGAEALTVSGYNATRYIDASCEMSGFGIEYALEFTRDSLQDFKLSLHDGSYYIDINAENGTLTAKTYPNAEAGVVETETLCTLPKGRHNYRIPVANGIAQLFIDNIWAYSFRLPTACAPCGIAFEGLEGVRIRETSDLYVFEDSFDGKAELPSKAYYSVTDGICADFDSTGMTLSPSDKKDAAEYISYLKAYANHPTFSAVVRVDRADEGGLWLAARYTNHYRHLRAGYNFDEGAWQIVKVETKTEMLASIPAEFPFGKEVHYTLTVNKDSAVLYADGVKLAETDSVKLSFYGVVGIIAKGVTAKVSHVSYEGCGRPVPNTMTFLNGAGSPEIFEYAPGNIFCVSNPTNLYESKDDGFTFEPAERVGFYSNMIRLRSGTIVSSFRKSVGVGYVDYSLVSKDNGASFEGPFPIQDYVINRITMNNKMTETSDGRLFFASGESGDGVEDVGGMRVFYSDDEGYTWHGASVKLLDGTVMGGGSEARLTLINTTVNCQESKVAEMPDGTLRLYVRTDEGFLYHSVSTDRGETWTAEMFTTPFISVLSAFNIELDQYTGDYYMAWEYNVKNDNKTIQFPRTRVALAVSRDKMRTWEYVADIDEVADYPSNFGHMNIGLKPTLNAVYVDAVKYNPDGSGKSPGRNYFVRVAKEGMKTTARFSRPHVLSKLAGTVLEAELSKNLLLVSADGRYAMFGAKSFVFSDGIPDSTSLSAIAAQLGAHRTCDDTTETLHIADLTAVFTVGEAFAVVNGERKDMSAPAVKTDDGIFVPVSVLSNLFGRKVITAANGTFVVPFDRFDVADADTLAAQAFWN